MREIGSEFWDVPIKEEENEIFPEKTKWFLSGRSALRAIIKEIKGCHTVAMPSWCCESMIRPFVEEGIEVRFYPVYFENGLVQEVRMDCDVLFLLDYFGYVSAPSELRAYEGVVIRDVTHSIFSKVYNDADYYFGSLRKWCGVWTGGFAWGENGRKFAVDCLEDATRYKELRMKAMSLKSSYVNGEHIDKRYLKVYKAAEEDLDNVYIGSAAESDIVKARKIDVELIKAQRKNNARWLQEAFRGWTIFPELKESDCPMFVPVLVPEGCRDALRHHLIDNEIYCPIHWPMSEYHKIGKRTEAIYKNEISLVCDQRYTEEDMKRIIEVIEKFWKGTR